MQKLTKEQADWLIEEINKQSWMYSLFNERGCTTALYTEDAQEIINKCTEKEFPKFEMTMNDNGIITIEHHLKKYIKLWTEFREPVLEYAEFLEYAQGVNKIADWIRQNNDI